MVIEISIQKLMLIEIPEVQLFRWLMINNIIKRIQNLTLNGKIQTFENSAAYTSKISGAHTEKDDGNFEEIDESIIRDMGVLNFIFEEDNV